MDNMIEFIDDYNLILPLWREAFGDSEEEIKFFTDNCKDARCLARFDGEELAAMLFLVDCVCSGENVKYIYAACTYKKFRKNGCMQSLLEYCEKNYNRLCLIPADEALCSYYAKRGFSGRANIDDIKFNQTDEIKEYLLDGCSLEKPFAMVYNKL